MAITNITLTSGMRQNLFSLQSTQKLMETTQKRCAAGFGRGDIRRETIVRLGARKSHSADGQKTEAV